MEKKMAERPVRILEKVGDPEAKTEQKTGKNLPPIEVSAFPEDIKRVIAGWREIDFKINPFLDIVLSNATPFYLEKTNSLAIVTNSEAGVEYIRSGEWANRTAEFLAERYQKNFDLQLLSAAEFENMHKHSLDEIKSAVERLRQNIHFDIEVKD